MQQFKLFCVLLAILATTGCATSIWELRYGKDKPPISYTFLTASEKRNGLFAWRPDTAAAVSFAVYVRDKDGNVVFDNTNEKSIPLYEHKTCVMSAAAIKARDSEGSLTLHITTPQDATGGELSAITRELQKITVLSSKSEAATFLDVALFGICMGCMNGYIQPNEAKDLMQNAISRAANIASNAEQTKINAIKGEADLIVPPVTPVAPGKPPTKPADPGIFRIPSNKTPKPAPEEASTADTVDPAEEVGRPIVAPGADVTKSGQ